MAQATDTRYYFYATASGDQPTQPKIKIEATDLELLKRGWPNTQWVQFYAQRHEAKCKNTGKKTESTEIYRVLTGGYGEPVDAFLFEKLINLLKQLYGRTTGKQLKLFKGI